MDRDWYLVLRTQHDVLLTPNDVDVNTRRVEGDARTRTLNAAIEENGREMWFDSNFLKFCLNGVKKKEKNAFREMHRPQMQTCSHLSFRERSRVCPTAFGSESATPPGRGDDIDS
jgi:hypothetical protein